MERRARAVRARQLIEDEVCLEEGLLGCISQKNEASQTENQGKEHPLTYTGPPMAEDERDRIGIFRPCQLEMDLYSLDCSQEVRVPIHSSLDVLPPVLDAISLQARRLTLATPRIAPAPIIDELSELGQIRTILPPGIRNNVFRR